MQLSDIINDITEIFQQILRNVMTLKTQVYHKPDESLVQIPIDLSFNSIERIKSLLSSFSLNVKMNPMESDVNPTKL